MDTIVQQALQTVLDGGQIDRATANALLSADKDTLYQAADQIRRHFHGNHFDLCSIINAKSGNCSENCRFCAQSARHHTGVDTYKVIAEDEAMAQARDNDQHGVHRISLVTSGRSLAPETVAELSHLFAKMNEATSMLFCASAGLLDEQITSDLYTAEMRRYHCNLKANKNYFPKICTTHT